MLYDLTEGPGNFYIGSIRPHRARDVVYDVTILEFGRRAHLKLAVTKLVDPRVVLLHGDEIVARIHVPEDINNTTITSAEVRTPRDY